MCRYRTLIISFIILASLLILPASVPVVRADAVVNPTDDAYVDVNKQTINLDDGALLVDYTYQTSLLHVRRAYLRFSLAHLTGAVSDAVVRLYVFLPAADTTGGVLALWSTGGDWNGGDTGDGDETTLTWANAPAPITNLDTAPAGAVDTWVEFTGSALVNYLNTQRLAGEPASFLVQWDSATDWAESDVIAFEDREDTGETTNYPELDVTGPTPVELASFTAAPLPGAIDLRWETATESDNLGFYLYRAGTPDGTPVRLNDALIPGQGDGPFGGQYQYVDRLLKPGRTMYYWLDSVDLYGVATRYGPVSAAADPLPSGVPTLKR